MNLSAFPRWLRQLAQYLPICSQLVVEGNIRDVHLIDSEDGLLLQPVVNCLWELLREQGCEGLLVYDRVSGMRVFPDDRRRAVEGKLRGGLGRRGADGPGSLEALQRRLSEVSESRDLCCAIVIDYASRLVRSANELEDAEYAFFPACQKARRHHARAAAARNRATDVQPDYLAG